MCESTKVCRQCGEAKSITDFYVHEKMADGRLNKCKTCVKNRVGVHREKNLDAINAYDRSRNMRADRVAARKQYIAERPWLKSKISLAWAKRNPEKCQAHSAVARAKRAGKLKPQPCAVCGAKNVHAHHPDYEKKLDVEWLCPKHHKDTHAVKG